MQIHNLTNMTNMNFGRRIKVAKDGDDVNKTLQAATLSGAYTASAALGSAAAGSEIAGCVFCFNSSGMDSSAAAPAIAETVAGSSPAVANYSMAHPSITSSALFTSDSALSNTVKDFNTKFVPTLKNNETNDN